MVILGGLFVGVTYVCIKFSHLLSSLMTVLIRSKTGFVPQLSSVVSMGTELKTMLVITWGNLRSVPIIITCHLLPTFLGSSPYEPHLG